MRFKVGMVRHILQRQIKGYLRRKYVSRILAKLNPPVLIKLVGQKNVLRDLEEVGFVALPKYLSEMKVAEIKQFIKEKKVYDRYDRKKRLFPSESPPNYARTGALLEEDVIKCPHVMDIANDKNILEVVSNYLGCEPTISNITLWNSYPSDTENPRDSECFHRDVDDFDFVKVFIYLTDVSLDQGPHVYVDYSHKNESLLDVKRFSDAEVRDVFDSSHIRTITGKAGDAFIENTYGLHRGTPLKRGLRTVLQIEYTLFSIGAYTYKNKLDDFDEAKYSPYINRLYLK